MRFSLALTLLVAAALPCGCTENPVAGPAAGLPPGLLDTLSPGDAPVKPGGTGTGNSAPVLQKIGDKVIQVGKRLVIEVLASDPDGTALTYSVYGDLPPGAKFFKETTPPTFDWTPSAASELVFLTFVVSDGDLIDRETVQISVVSQGQNFPPVFQKVGDQVLEVGLPYVLPLQATDPNGDSVIYGVEGQKPAGSSLDAANGIFRWTPTVDDYGAQVDVTFSASDGQEKTTLVVPFHVLAQGESNKPPAFLPVGPQTARVGQPYALVVQAVDSDGDTVTYGLDGTPPPGSAFDPGAHTFNWVPLADQANKVFTLWFWATDQTYRTYHDVDVAVLPAGRTPGECSDDPLEPNNTPDTATPVTVGTYELSVCDTDLSPVDQDWFQIVLTEGQTLSVQATFVHQAGDLDMEVYAPGGSEPAAQAKSSTDNELLAYAATTPGPHLIRVFGAGAGSFAQPYTLLLSTTGLGCQDDGMEPNNTLAQATVVEAGANLGALHYCPGNPDNYRIQVGCGQTLTASVGHDPVAGDLDVYLLDPAAPLVPLASAVTSMSPETLSWEATTSRQVVLRVVGYPPESTSNGYALTTSLSGGASCTPDALDPNDTKATAVILPPPVAKKSNLVLCCTPDWFYVPMAVGEALLASVKFAGEAAIEVEVRATDGVTVIASGEPDSQGLLVELGPVAEPGNYYLVVTGPQGSPYDIEAVVLTNDGCSTSKGCPEATVCKPSTGSCVADTCASASDCPFGLEMPCLDGTCMDGCTYDADCRLGYRCKGFATGRYCGIDGWKTTGEPCFTYGACAGSSSCAFQTMGGYCTNLGCTSEAECLADADCVVGHDGKTLCGKVCASNADCRVAAGFSCQPTTLLNGVPTQVCLPIP